jgi:hypothetical protein
MVNRVKAVIQERSTGGFPVCSCGSCSFIQKELKKTGLVIKNGKLVYGKPTPALVGFICAKCGELMSAEDAKKIAKSDDFLSAFLDDENAPNN